MENIYSNPKSELETGSIRDFSFSNLGFWRKLYLVLNWFFVAAIPAFILIGVFSSNQNGLLSGISVWQILIIVMLAGYTYWLHIAISTRNTTQLLILIIIQIIPFLNPISALIIFAIRRTSIEEIEGK